MDVISTGEGQGTLPPGRRVPSTVLVAWTTEYFLAAIVPAPTIPGILPGRAGSFWTGGGEIPLSDH
jgi:hypothetical protein